jgi:uncharacterized protein (TIGR02271 family)
MLSTQQAQDLLANGGQVIDNNDDKIGKVGQIFLDDETGEPAWVTVKTGMFGGAESFVPLQTSTLAGDDVRVGYDKATVKDAPRIEDADGHLSHAEEDDLYTYYGLQHGQSQAPEADSGPEVSEAVEPVDDATMTRSEEQLNIGKETGTVGRARLRKYVVTENVTTTVPVSHEEVRIEREPITDADRGEATSGAEISEEVQEVELKGERVVVDKETVPVERVRLGTETVTEDQQVSEDVRKEQIETPTPRSAPRAARVSASPAGAS